MEKEIFVKKFIDRDEEFGILKEKRRGRDGMRVDGHEHRRREHPHEHHGRDRGRPEDKRPRDHRRHRSEHTLKTKMFTSKKELVEYVNSIGELGNKIDIFKIEDDLYKVVILERKAKNIKETE